MFVSWCMVFVVVLFFFFKQKTAYEMRISDWSSDVCSSDLLGLVNWVVPRAALDAETDKLARRLAAGPTAAYDKAKRLFNAAHTNTIEAQLQMEGEQIGRASCRERVCSTCRSRWSPYH